MTADRGRASENVAEHIRVSGRVQGVGFRYFACEAAAECGVFGWVRNLPDGTVDLHVEGPRDAVERMIATLRSGPPFGRVDHLDRRGVDVERIREFGVRY